MTPDEIRLHGLGIAAPFDTALPRPQVGGRDQMDRALELVWYAKDAERLAGERVCMWRTLAIALGCGVLYFILERWINA